MDIGLNTYAFKWALSAYMHNDAFEKCSIHDILDMAAGHGVRVLQICDNYPLFQVSDENLSAIFEDATDKGISLEVGTRGTDPTILKEYLSIAGKLHSKIVRTMIFSDDGHIPALARIKTDLASAAEEFENKGVCLAIENYEIMPSSTLADIIENVGSDAIGICLDTGNSLGVMEWPEETVNKLVKHARSIHLKDFVIKRVAHGNGFIIEGCPLGRGMLNIDIVFNALDKYGLSPHVIVEHWTPYTRSIQDTITMEREWMESSLSYLKNYLSDHRNNE